jgi:uncharacterized protein (TIGR03435 family)
MTNPFAHNLSYGKKALLTSAAILLMALGWVCAYGQEVDGPSFEVASVKPASPSGTRIGCSGGPGSTDPGIWSCSNVVLAFLISHAYGFQPYEFAPSNSCCQDGFDINAKVPAGTTREQFLRMQQNLLAERFKLKLHHEQKEMAIYELTVGEKGPKMKGSTPDAASTPEDPWTPPAYFMGEDGYPIFPAGRGGLSGRNGHYRWTGFNLSMQKIVKTLSGNLGRPVVDATGLKGKYDINMTWTTDLASIQALLAAQGMPPMPEADSGPTLLRAVQDQLGLKLNSKKGYGEIVVVDHVDKVPTGN